MGARYRSALAPNRRLTMPTPFELDDSPTIHVVDDDEAVRQSLGFLLEAASFKVRLHGSATGLLDAPGPPAWGCLVVDYDMPRIGGLELLRRLRLRRIALPCIVITGKIGTGIRVAALAAGAAAVIEKPFESDELILAIRMALSEP